MHRQPAISPSRAIRASSSATTLLATCCATRTGTSPASATPRTTPRARSAPATSVPRARSGTRSTCSAACASSGSRSSRTTIRSPARTAYRQRPAIFPEAYLLLRSPRQSRPREVTSRRRREPPSTTRSSVSTCRRIPNDGLRRTSLTKAPIDSLVNGKIDENAGCRRRASRIAEQIEGLALRGAWSQTVARPSFREMGYYVSVEPGTDDLIVGNPQLKLSDVESYDLRARVHVGRGRPRLGRRLLQDHRGPDREHRDPQPDQLRGSVGALPHVLQQPQPGAARGHRDRGCARTSTSSASTWPPVLLGRRQLHVHRRQGRPQQVRAQRAQPFFGARRGRSQIHQGLSTSRRLFGQPEWIANADLSFDQPEWGTQVTSRSSRSATCSTPPAGEPQLRTTRSISITLDRYIDSYSRLDVIVSQRLTLALRRRPDLQDQREESDQHDAPYRLRPRSDGAAIPRALLQDRSELQVHDRIRVLTCSPRKRHAALRRT